MDSLVLELQRDTLDRDIKIADLLRKALLVSKKLKIKDIEEWINDELNGYVDKPAPEYRAVYGELKAKNPYASWIPVVFPVDLQEVAQKRYIHLSVSQLEDLAKPEGEYFLYKFPPDQAQKLRNLSPNKFEIALHIPNHHLARILDTTKTKIMEFALDLESKGILGEGMTFTKDEQNLAQTITINTIHIERMENSQIQQAAQRSEQFKE